MSDLPTCPCCGGILDVPLRYKLSSACRCGYPDKVSWDELPALTEMVERDLRFTMELQRRRA